MRLVFSTFPFLEQKSINKRLPEISIDECLFNEAAPLYQKALDNSGYNQPVFYISRERARVGSYLCYKHLMAGALGTVNLFPKNLNVSRGFYIKLSNK